MTRALVATGHLVDAPDRTAPRFPPERVGWVTDRIRFALDEWGIGPETRIICGGARGADIIAAELGRARGAGVTLCLALPPDEFRRRSVDLPGTDWGERFRRLLRVAEVRCPAEERDGPPGGDDAFARTNAWMVRLARALDPEPLAIVVWDGLAGDGPGGTGDLVRQLGYPVGDPRMRIIDPTPPGADPPDPRP